MTGRVRDLIAAVGDVLRDPVVPVALVAVGVGWVVYLSRYPIADVARGYALGWAIIFAAVALLAVYLKVRARHGGSR